MDKIKVGVIGCGSIAIHRHVPEYAANPNVEIVALCDVVKERAEALADKYGGTVYTDYMDVINREDIDAVSVCLPNYLHAPVSIAALEAGKHVLCEKPMATSAEEAEAMIRAAKSSGKILMIGHNQRLMPPHVKARQILESGELGKIYSFRTAFGHAGPEGWCVDKSKKTWFFRKKEAFVGAMGDLGVHKADLIRWLLGEEIVEVGAFVETRGKTYDDGQLIDVDDNAVCVLKSESGIIGTLTASWTYRGGEDNSTTIYCEKGVMKLGADPDFEVVVNYTNGQRACYKVGEIATNEKQASSGVIDLFVKHVVNGEQPIISGDEGYKALKIVLACLESAEKKTFVQVK